MIDSPRQIVPNQSAEGEDYGPTRYGRSFADVYDDWYSDLDDLDLFAEFMSQFGSTQRILELGVGTGRLARPLHQAGHSVIGIDASLEMLVQTPPESAPVAAGDMSVLPFRDASFDTVLVATNTLFNLDSEATQATSFKEARRTLRLGGRFIVQAMIPAEPDPTLDRLVTTRSLSPDHAVLTATIRDPADQVITGQHIEIRESGIRLRPWRVRYLTLAQLDSIARAAGFRLGRRWEGWDQAPVTDDSTSAISSYVAI